MLTLAPPARAGENADSADKKLRFSFGVGVSILILKCTVENFVNIHSYRIASGSLCKSVAKRLLQEVQ